MLGVGGVQQRSVIAAMFIAVWHIYGVTRGSEVV
jgi:hypothetical protein